MQYSRKLDVTATPDVLVCGAGCAGTTAAIAAARRGASVMLIERFGFAGGYITGVIGASFDGWVDLRSGRPVVGGLVAEFAHSTAAQADMMSASYSPSNELREMRETPNRRPIRFNIEGFKRNADRMFRKAGARVLYYTSVVDVLREGERITGVVIANKAGLSVIQPKQVVDATGDADVAAWAGAPFDMSDEMQPMSLHFRMGNVRVGATTRDECSAAREGRAGARRDRPLWGTVDRPSPSRLGGLCQRLPFSRERHRPDRSDRGRNQGARGRQRHVQRVQGFGQGTSSRPTCRAPVRSSACAKRAASSAT